MLGWLSGIISGLVMGGVGTLLKIRFNQEVMYWKRRSRDVFHDERVGAWCEAISR